MDANWVPLMQRTGSGAYRKQCSSNRLQETMLILPHPIHQITRGSILGLYGCLLLAEFQHRTLSLVHLHHNARLSDQIYSLADLETSTAPSWICWITSVAPMHRHGCITNYKSLSFSYVYIHILLSYIDSYLLLTVNRIYQIECNIVDVMLSCIIDQLNAAIHVPGPMFTNSCNSIARQIWQSSSFKSKKYLNEE